MELNSSRYRKEYTKDFVEHWDDLIDWKGRAQGEKGFFQDLLRNAGVKSVADIASGTGFHAVNFAKSGFEVVASDGSRNMLEKTRENARRHNAPLCDIVQSDWRDLPKNLGEDTFDAVLCLGNAFTHLFEHEARVETLGAIFSIIKPGGMAVIDHRNYDHMLENGYSSKHRFYYTGKNVEAYPEKLDETVALFRYEFSNGNTFHLNLFPLAADYLTEMLEDTGFVDIKRYGDFEIPYDVEDVDFIQQVGQKPAS